MPQPSNLVVTMTAGELEELLRKTVDEAIAARQASPQSEWLDIKEAALYVGLNPGTLARHARAGRVPSHRAGREYRFRRSELDAWLSQRAA